MATSQSSASRTVVVDFSEGSIDTYRDPASSDQSSTAGAGVPPARSDAQRRYVTAVQMALLTLMSHPLTPRGQFTLSFVASAAASLAGSPECFRSSLTILPSRSVTTLDA